MDNLARNLEGEDHHTETPEKDSPEKKKKEQTSSFNQEKLSVQERQDLKNKKVTIDGIVAERMQVEAAAEAELKSLLARNSKDDELLSVKEYQEYQNRIKETESPDKLEEIVDELKKLPEQKAKEKKDAAYEAKERHPEHPELLKLQEKFIKTCKLNRALIGESQMKGFEEWIQEQRKEKPSIKHLKDCLSKLEGTKVFDKNGLAPRREEYGKLQELFEKNGLNSPLESTYIRTEGLSERTHFRKNAETLENHLRVRKDTELYSPKIMKEMMQEILLANNPAEQEKMLLEADNIARKESESLTHLDSTMTVQGMTIRCMSAKSKDECTGYYKDMPLSKRMENLNKWQGYVKEEGNLVFKLEEIYEDDPKGFKLALAGFEDKNWGDKEKEIAKHQKLVEAAENKEEMHKELIIKAADSKIDEAVRKKIIPEGESKTEGKLRKLFSDENNFKNSETQKTGDLGEMEKAFKWLTNNSATTNPPNLAAFEKEHTEYHKTLKFLTILNPHLTKEEIAEWEENYDEVGWTPRLAVKEDLRKAFREAEKDKEKLKAIKTVLGDDQAENDNEEIESNESLQEVLKKANNLLLEKQNEEGYAMLSAYWLKNKDTLSTEEKKEVESWMKFALERINTIGRGEKLEATAEKEIEKEVEKLAHGEEFHDQLKEEQVIRLNIQGAKLSENRHQHKKSAKDRALQDSLDDTDEGSLEEELVEDFYKNTDGYILDDEGTGDEIEEHRMDEISLTKEEQNAMRQDTYDNQGQLTSKEGFAFMNFVDKGNQKISAQRAEDVQKADLEVIEDEMVDKATENVNAKIGIDTSNNNVFDLQSRIAARRKAKTEIEEHTTEKLKSSAG